MTENSAPPNNPDDRLNPYIDGLTHSAVAQGLETTKRIQANKEADQRAADKSEPKTKPFHFYRKVMALGGALAALVSAATGIEKVNEARVQQELNDLGANAYVANIETDPHAVTIAERTRIEMSLFENTIQLLKNQGVIGPNHLPDTSSVSLAFDVIDGDKTIQIKPDAVDLLDPQAAIDMLTKTRQELAQYSKRQHVAVKGAMELHWEKNVEGHTFGVTMNYSTENPTQKTSANGEIIDITEPDMFNREGPGFNPEVNVKLSVAPISQPQNSKEFIYILPEPHGTFANHWRNGKIQIYESRPPVGPLFRDLDPGDKGVLLANFPSMLPAEVVPKFISAVVAAPIYTVPPQEVAQAVP